ncbi:hypothetical protein CCHR01_14330 [Colletotrichum chrysophilum]|uniref:Integrase catalytic domain-containing protein n=1 Tax=Colletotrichum chrysophilum TaxID=1836956 RepID=A0AAD9A9S9_9PEZI|nr:hypothetical protein CCHR01_14330 [Colletotrichum chrysophilum]
MDWQWTIPEETRIREPVAMDHEVQEIALLNMIIDENTSGGNDGSIPVRDETMADEDHSFNYEVIVDIFYLDGNKPVLHIVDTATAFNAARFLEDISAKQTWEALRMCWIDVYQSPPDWIVTDAETNFRSEEFRQSARSMAISIKEISIEAHNSIGKVERYHKPLRRAYEIIKAENPSLRPEVAL